jgi:DNA repair protein RadC
MKRKKELPKYMNLYAFQAPVIRMFFENQGLPMMQREKIGSSSDAARIIKEVYNPLALDSQEQFYSIYLNRQNRVISVLSVSEGSAIGTVVDVKKVLQGAIECGAEGVILCHNHPSGTVNPSQADIDITKKIKEVCKLMDIQLLDHVIVTGFNSGNTMGTGHYSFADEGII